MGRNVSVHICLCGKKDPRRVWKRELSIDYRKLLKRKINRNYS